MHRIAWITRALVMITGAAVLLTAPPSEALENPGFESPDFGAGGWRYFHLMSSNELSAAAWTHAGGGAGLSGPNGPWKCNTDSPDPLGDQFGFLQAASSLSQTVSGLVAGVTYDLSFYESYRVGTFPGNDLAVVLDDGLSSAMTIYTNAGVTNAVWELRRSDSFVASNASVTLTFRTTSPLGRDNSTLIDGVSLHALAAPGPPTVSLLSPPDDAIGAQIDSDLVVRFNEYVQAGTGTVEIWDSGTGGLVQSIDITSPNVTVNGQDVTVNPSSDFLYTNGYYVTIAAGAIEDLSGDPFGGISGTSTWNFVTRDVSPVSVHVITGDADSDISTDKTYTHTLDFGQGVPGALINGVQFDPYNVAANGTLNFRRTVSSGTINDHAGNGTHNLSGGLADLMADMYFNGATAAGGTTTWTLSGLTGGVAYETRIYVRQWAASTNRTATLVFDPDGPGVISDETDVISEDGQSDAYFIRYPFVAVAGHDLVIEATQHNATFSWHLYGLSNEGQDTNGPVAITLSPADDTNGVLVVRDLLMTFDENFVLGQVNMTLTNLSDGTATVLTTNNAQVSVSGRTLRVNPDADLLPLKDYAVLLDAGAVFDRYDNASDAFSDTTTWNFTTGPLDFDPPVMAVLNPADGADDMSTGADLAITFDEDVQPGAGSIHLRWLDGGALFETIDVPGSNVVASGRTVTVNPTGDLASATAYYVEITPGAIEDISGNDFGGIADSTTWNFTTLAAGLLTFHPIANDLESGLSSNRTYTHAIDFGNSGAATVNGVIFGSDVNVVAGGRTNVGTRTYGPLLAAGSPPAVAGGVVSVFNDFRYNGPDLGYVELTGLTPGRLYELRLYDRAWDYELIVRTYQIAYDLGGDGSVEYKTPQIDQNRAMLTPPALPGNVSWAMSYVYLADASGKIRVNIDLADDGGGTYHLFGLTNEELPGDGTVAWAGLGVSNLTATSVSAFGAVNTDLDDATLVWDRTDRGAGSVNDWTNAVSLGAQASGPLSYALTNLMADTQYTFRYYGTNTLPAEGWSDAATFVTALSGAQTPVFTNAVTNAWNAITLGWQDNASNETAYILERSTLGAGGPYSPLATLAAGTTTFREVVATGRRYYYQLAATNQVNGSVTDFASCQTSVWVPARRPRGVLFRDDFSQSDTTFNQTVENNFSLFGAVVGDMPQTSPTYATTGAIGGENGTATWGEGGGNRAYSPNYNFALNSNLVQAAAFTVSLKDLTPGNTWTALAVFDDNAMGALTITEPSVGLGALFGPGPGGGIQVWSQGSFPGPLVATTPSQPFDVTFAITNVSGFGPSNSFDYTIFVNTNSIESGTKTNINTALNYIVVEASGGVSTVGELEVLTTYISPPFTGLMLIVK